MVQLEEFFEFFNNKFLKGEFKDNCVIIEGDPRSLVLTNVTSTPDLVEENTALCIGRELSELEVSVLKGKKPLTLLVSRHHLDVNCLVRCIHPEPNFVCSVIAGLLFPSKPAHIVAMTGTNGKTSTTCMVYHIWRLLGYKTAMFGTLGTSFGLSFPLSANTTLPAPLIHRALHECAQAGIDRVVTEASSHGLSQYRLHHVPLQAAGFTNLTHDHLEYHGSMEAYREAKLKLFTEVLPKGHYAVINRDDAASEFFLSAATERQHKIITYGWHPASSIRLQKVSPLEEGLEIEYTFDNHNYTVIIPLVGLFQAHNFLCALGLLIAEGISLEAVNKVVGCIPPVRGRLERIVPNVYVDYAHTPNGLKTVLKTMQIYCGKEKKLHVVMGCGGNRDKTKRPVMGKIADRYADYVYITDDNPRFEDPSQIRAAIASTCPKATIIADRKTAIVTALKALQFGDILVIAGKGHEQTQIIAGKHYFFDDATVVREAYNNN